MNTIKCPFITKKGRCLLDNDICIFLRLGTFAKCSIYNEFQESKIQVYEDKYIEDPRG